MPDGAWGNVSQAFIQVNVHADEQLADAQLRFVASSTDDGYHLELNGAVVVEFNHAHYSSLPEFRAGGLFATSGDGGWTPWTGEGNPEFVYDSLTGTVELLLDDNTGGRQDALPFIAAGGGGIFEPVPVLDFEAGVTIGTGFSDRNGIGPIRGQQITFSANTVRVIDTDLDGVEDRLDIDSDNDGITDNVEAQLTANYIAPSGVGGTTAFIDTNQDGLDDNFDAGIIAGGAHTGVGLTPVDTDSTLPGSDGVVDYLDTDSDNDGLDDAAEAGHGLSIQTGLSDATTDADGDGLFLSLIHI